MKIKKFFNCILVFLVVILLLPAAYPVTGEEVIIYYNKACGGCTDYISEHLIPMLKEMGFNNIVMKDYVNDQTNRAGLNKINEEIGVPPKLQGHFTISDKSKEDIHKEIKRLFRDKVSLWRLLRDIYKLRRLIT